jgi:hypothetical protein
MQSIAEMATMMQAATEGIFAPRMLTNRCRKSKSLNASSSERCLDGIRREA